MCSVIGFQSKEPKKAQLEFLMNVLFQSRIRGVHAFGFAVRRETGIEIFRTSKFDNFQDRVRAAWPFTHFIGHCRYSTSGDWKNPENNQPIKLGDNALVFNGVISMKTKEEIEKEFGVQMATDNDGEVALARYIGEPRAFAQWLQPQPFSFAGIFLDRGGMMAIRNKNRPLWMTRHLNATVLASTGDILHRAGALQRNRLPDGVPVEVECL